MYIFATRQSVHFQWLDICQRAVLTESKELVSWTESAVLFASLFEPEDRVNEGRSVP